MKTTIATKPQRGAKPYKGKKMALVKPQGSTYAGASVRVKAGGGYNIVLLIGL